ncbi:MAG: DUF4331 family protein [Pyrinomonadaceae bacterium]
MNFRRLFLRALVFMMAVGMVLTGLTFSPTSQAADHRDSITADAAQEGDMTDVFAHLDPEFPDRLVLTMPVNPFANPSELPSYRFAGDFLYSFKIDNNGDGVPEFAVQFKFFSDNGAPPQQYTVKFDRILSPRTPILNEVVDTEFNDERIICRGDVYQGSVENRTATQAQGIFGTPTRPGVRCFAGVRDDPFVTDVAQAVFRIGLNPNPVRNSRNHNQDIFRELGALPAGSRFAGLRGRPLRPDTTFPGVTSGFDGFGGFNVTALSVEIPKSLVAGPGFPAQGTTVIPSTDQNGDPITVPANDLGIRTGTNPTIPACPGCVGVWGTVSRAKGDHFDPSWIQPFGRPGNNLQEPNNYIQFERMGQQLFNTVFIFREPPTNSTGEFVDITDNKVKDVFNRLAPQWDVENFGYLVPDSLLFDAVTGAGENSIQGRRAILASGGFLAPPNGVSYMLDQLAPPFNVLRTTNTDPRLLQRLLLPDMLRVDLNNMPDGIRPYAATAGTSSPYFGILSIGAQNGRRPSDDITDIYLRTGRELVDVTNDEGLVGRRALRCQLLSGSAGNTCYDARVTAVLQGTDFIESSPAKIDDLSNQGEDRFNPASDRIALTFPFLADEHPVTGETTGGGTVGFPTQNFTGTAGGTR